MTSEKRKRDVHRDALRFQIHLPMRFRILGERIWHDAWADSMSLTSIVFRGDEMMEIGKTLDIRLMLPRPEGRRSGGTIVSRARVIRSSPLSEASGQAIISAALASPRLLRYMPEKSRSPWGSPGASGGGLTT